ncbi:DUF2937 family protein [Jiella sp. M17.18]|uniref:DUF2937 family protein n=1 Tax=Jiella sp. M17.18 TaxID=3234247 RepID=UPI0034DE5E52
MVGTGNIRKGRPLVALLARVLAALVLGSAFSQSVEFTQQYLQRLGGAADELRIVVERFDDSARAMQLSPEEAMRRLKGNGDALAAKQGEDAAASAARYAAVERRYRNLKGTAPLFRPFVFAGDPDWAIARRTGGDYRPALPVTVDGLFLGFAGFVLGWALGSGAHGAVRMRKRRTARRAEAAAAGETGTA